MESSHLHVCNHYGTGGTHLIPIPHTDLITLINTFNEWAWICIHAYPVWLITISFRIICIVILRTSKQSVNNFLGEMICQRLCR